jgi:MoxR-like ATPase
MGDRDDSERYRFNERIVLAVNVALATTRPLLVRGPSGSGKSSLARSVAHHNRWRYYETVMTSRTQARDLLWHFDALRRLGDAQAGRLKEEASEYVEPGILWWAFDPDSARRRGRDPEHMVNAEQALAAAPLDPNLNTQAEAPDAVVLLDEIDKCDPDVPNDLLIPLGSFRFTLRETGIASREIPARHRVLVIVTTNEERQLSPAFQRRCVLLQLGSPGKENLIAIGRKHFGSGHDELLTWVASYIVDEAEKTTGSDSSEERIQPSAAEYLDAVRACQRLEEESDQADRLAIVQAALRKAASPASTAQ